MKSTMHTRRSSGRPSVLRLAAAGTLAAVALAGCKAGVVDETTTPLAEPAPTEDVTETEEPTTTTITLYWDLHCWEFQASVVPFGIRKSYQVHINVKASILQDLKLQRRGNLGSNQNYF